MLHETLERIVLYESTELLSDRFRRLHNQALSGDKAREIIAHIRQGRELIENASQAPYHVRPLIAYYGVLALSRGLTLFLDSKKRQSSLAQKHGVAAHQWQQCLSHGICNLGNATLRISKSGTFAELAGATICSDFTEIDLGKDSSGAWRSIGTAVFQAAVDVSVESVIRSIPDLVKVSRLTVAGESLCHAVMALQNEVSRPPEEPADEQLRVVFVSSPITQEDEEVIRQLLGLPDEYDLDRGNFQLADRRVSGLGITIDIDGSRVGSTPVRIPHFRSDKRGNLFATEELAPGLQLSKLTLLFLFSFFLGTLARYCPSEWMELQNGGRGDAWFPVLRAALELTINEFPLLIADELEDAFMRQKIPGNRLVPEALVFRVLQEPHLSL